MHPFLISKLTSKSDPTLQKAGMTLDPKGINVIFWFEIVCATIQGLRQ